MKLNVGCGPHYAQGWTNLDRHHDDGINPDIVGTIFQLPDASCERIYLGHVMEHQRWEQIPMFLAQIRYLLVPDGQVLATGPDVNRTLALHANGLAPAWLVHDVLEHADEESPNWPGSAHHWNCSEGRMEKALTAAGFSTKTIPPEDLTNDWEGWPVTNWSMWQCAVLAW